MALEQGRIVWARVADPSGRNHKCRPLVIVTRTEEIDPAQSVQAVAVTTRVNDPLPPNHVKLPWHRNRHPRTWLRTPCVAVCDWVVEIEPGAIEEIGGIVPTKQLREILVRVADRSRALADEGQLDRSEDTSGAPPAPEDPPDGAD